MLSVLASEVGLGEMLVETLSLIAYRNLTRRDSTSKKESRKIIALPVFGYPLILDCVFLTFSVKNVPLLFRRSPTNSASSITADIDFQLKETTRKPPDVDVGVREDRRARLFIRIASQIVQDASVHGGCIAFGKGRQLIGQPSEIPAATPQPSASVLSEPPSRNLIHARNDCKDRSDNQSEQATALVDLFKELEHPIFQLHVDDTYTRSLFGRVECGDAEAVSQNWAKDKRGWRGAGIIVGGAGNDARACQILSPRIWNCEVDDSAVAIVLATIKRIAVELVS
ncbi:hypothetical protein CPC08DRAFT_731477 [Agrocybe pediades]|nr:hypothetical protein CPC08DRAFT_731477 [Agrocybe pediades]